MATTLTRWLAALLTGATACLAVHAAGVLYTNDKPGNPKPLRWNTSKPIPVEPTWASSPATRTARHPSSPTSARANSWPLRWASGAGSPARR